MTIKEFYELTGSDYADVLSRLPNDAFILRFLKKYIASDEMDKMVASFEARDYQSLFVASHSLKGMSANMGLAKFTGTVSEICESVRHGEPNKDLLPLVEQAKEEHSTIVKLVNQL